MKLLAPTVVPLALALTASIAAPQTPAREGARILTGGAAIGGVLITDEPSPQPVRRAAVTLSAVEGGSGRVTVTDDRGRFSIGELPAGRYTLSAARAGFITVLYGAKRPGGPGLAISLVDGQQLSDITLKMLRGAVITGTVRDERGEPVPGVRANVMTYRFNAQTGERSLTSASRGFGEETDDRGRYRVFGLPPGEYIVLVTHGIGPRTLLDMYQTTSAEVQWGTAQLRSGVETTTPPLPARQRVAYAPVFYPGTPSPSGAVTLTLTAGEERTNVDLPLVLIPTANITGTVRAADGSPAPPVQLAIIAHDRIEGLPFSGFNSTTTTTGDFSFTGLAPGVYTVTARVSPNVPGPAREPAKPVDPSMLALYATADVTVGGTDTTVALTLQPGVAVTGRVRFDGTSPAPGDLTKIRVDLSAVATGNSATLGVPAATVAADGTFKFGGVTPGRYRLTASVPGSTPTSGWQLKHGFVNSQDTLDVPLDVRSADIGDAIVVFTDRPAQLSGRVQDASGQPAPEYFIIAFAADRAFWTPRSRRIQSVRPGSDGRFRMPNLPPGDYLIAAVTDVEDGRWFDPTFLQGLVPAATKISIADGEQKAQDFKVGSR